MVDKTTFDTVVKETGPLKDRTDVESASNEIRQGVENLLEQSRKIWLIYALILQV